MIFIMKTLHDMKITALPEYLDERWEQGGDTLTLLRNSLHYGVDIHDKIS
jgi:hypothetical protein